MSEIKNGRLGLYGTEHSRGNHMMTLDSKGLVKKLHINSSCTEYSILFGSGSYSAE